MNDTERRYTTKDLAEMLGVEAVTVRKYAIALEKAGYIVERGESKNRLYTERDAMAFQQLKTIRERSGLTVEKSADVVATKHREASESVSPSVQMTHLAEIEHYAEQYAELLRTKMVAGFEKILERQRTERVDEMITTERIKSQLRDEAEKLWAEKTEAERMRKAGWFRKEEDMDARERFIRKHIVEHYAERLRVDFGLEDRN